MAISDAYASAATYRALLSKTDTSEDAEILTDLTAISRWIDKHLRRHFSRDTAATARPRYVGSDYPGGLVRSRDGRSLWIPDVGEKATFALKRDEDRDGSFADETAWTIDVDFQLLPLSAEAGPEAEPWTQIYLPSWSAKTPFAAGDYLEITSKEGWPAIPSAIERSCCQITAILRLESPRATRRIPEGGIAAAADASPDALAIVRSLAEDYGRGDLR